MSLFTPTRINKEFKVNNSDYIHTENSPNEGEDKPVVPVNPGQPEAA